MKKNLTLLGVLIGLLIVTYFLQEKRIEDLFVSSLQEGRIIEGEIKSLKLLHVEARKIGSEWRSETDLLSHNSFSLIEKKILELKEIKEIEGNWESFFSDPVSFEVNEKKITLGDMSFDKKGFYIGVQDKIFLGFVDGGNTRLTQHEEELPRIKRDELISLISKSYNELVENQLFRYFPELPMARALIQVEGYLDFELDFINNRTLPPPVKGVEVHAELKEKFRSLLTQLTIRKIIRETNDIRFKKLGEISFLDEDEKSVTWELWQRNKESADAVIVSPGKKESFLMSGGTLKVFFVSLQDYWDKKVIPSSEFKSFIELSMIFREGDKEAHVKVINSEPMEFKVKGYEIQKPKMVVLVSMILNLGQFDQAERVSELTTSERKQLLAETNLQVAVFGVDLLLWRKEEELIVVNLTQRFKAHFNLTDENFLVNFQDVLK